MIGGRQPDFALSTEPTDTGPRGDGEFLRQPMEREGDSDVFAVTLPPGVLCFCPGGSLNVFGSARPCGMPKARLGIS